MCDTWKNLACENYTNCSISPLKTGSVDFFKAYEHNLLIWKTAFFVYVLVGNFLQKSPLCTCEEGYQLRSDIGGGAIDAFRGLLADIVTGRAGGRQSVGVPDGCVSCPATTYVRINSDKLNTLNKLVSPFCVCWILWHKVSILFWKKINCCMRSTSVLLCQVEHNVAAEFHKQHFSVNFCEKSFLKNFVLFLILLHTSVFVMWDPECVCVSSDLQCINFQHLTSCHVLRTNVNRKLST